MFKSQSPLLSLLANIFFIAMLGGYLAACVSAARVT